jgi:hypothetical protein
VLLAVYAKFTVFNNYFLETFSVYLLVVGWLFAPVMFNPNGLDSQAVIDDFDKWVAWMLSSVEVGIYPNIYYTYDTCQYAVYMHACCSSEVALCVRIGVTATVTCVTVHSCTCRSEARMCL